MLFQEIIKFEMDMKSPSIMKQFFFNLMCRMIGEVDGQKRLVVNYTKWQALKEGYIATVNEAKFDKTNAHFAEINDK